MMFTGNFIDDLIATVERAEARAQRCVEHRNEHREEFRAEFRAEDLRTSQAESIMQVGAVMQIELVMQSEPMMQIEPWIASAQEGANSDSTHLSWQETGVA